jgi:peroxiredoxin Q/BCP
MEKENLRIDLISDQDLVLHKKYAAWGEKKNYGKVYEGTIRSTFLLDAEGIVMLEWRNVKAKGHAERVLSEIKE